MAAANSEIEELKIIYSEIIQGSSYIYSPNLYVKHFNEVDNIEVLKEKKRLLIKYKKDGIPSEEDKLKTALEQGEWTKANEENIDFLKLNIHDNEKNVMSIIPQQREGILKMIELRKQELITEIIKRREILGNTAEEFCNRDIINFITCKSLYKDSRCLVAAFDSQDEFENLEDEELDNLIHEVDISASQFSDQNIKKISCMSFFINPLSYVKDNWHNFFNLPIAIMSNYQYSLLAMGARNISTLQNSENEPPLVLTSADIENVVNFFDAQYSILIGKRNTTTTKKR